VGRAAVPVGQASRLPTIKKPQRHRVTEKTRKEMLVTAKTTKKRGPRAMGQGPRAARQGGGELDQQDSREPRSRRVTSQQAAGGRRQAAGSRQQER
jgi:hypothetical protein